MPLREVRVTPPSTMSCRALSACLSLRPSNAASMAAQRGPMPRTQLVADRKTRWQRRHLVACSVVLLMSELYITSTCTCKPHVIVGCMDEQPKAKAPATPSETPDTGACLGRAA